MTECDIVVLLRPAKFSILSSTERSEVRIEGCGFAGLIAFAAPFDTISASLQSLRMLPLSSYDYSTARWAKVRPWPTFEGKALPH